MSRVKLFQALLLFCTIFLGGCMGTEDGFISGEVNINGSASSDNLNNYTIEYQPDGSSEWKEVGMNLTESDVSVNNSILGQWESSYVKDGAYTLRLNVTDGWNRTMNDYVYIDVDNFDIDKPVNNSHHIADNLLYIEGTATGSQYNNYTICYSNSSSPGVCKTQGVVEYDNGYPNKTNETLGYINTSNFSNGNYMINFSMPNKNGFTANYMLNISVMVPDEYEPDDNFTMASPFELNTTQEHSFLPEDDEDYVSFNATAGKKYIIETSASSNGNLTKHDTVLTLYDENGTYIGGDDDGGPNYLSYLSYVPSDNTTLYVKVENFWGEAGGNYKISIKERSKYFKGAVPESYSSGHPYFTYNSNPINCTNMTYGDYCNMTWKVRTVGAVGSEFDFFTIMDNGKNKKITEKQRFSIKDPTPQITLVNPANKTSLYENTTEVSIEIETNVPSKCRFSSSPYFY